MEIIEKIGGFSDKSVVTVGAFDGIHLAHKKIIGETVNEAASLGLKSIVFTFENLPRNFFSELKVKSLTTKDEKLKLLEDLGVDYVFFQKFDKDFANLEPEDFIELLLRDFGMKVLFMGDDNKIGKKGKGTFEYLLKISHKINFSVRMIDGIFVDGIRVSSSNIRKFLLQGDVATASRLLGYNYSVSGNVVQGDGIGRKIGFPTANIDVAENKLMPDNGVYAVFVYIDQKKYPAMANIGVKPTIALKDEPVLEVNIFDFNKNIYGQRIRVEFLEKIRNERKFNSVDDLIRQLNYDSAEIFSFLNGILSR